MIKIDFEFETQYGKFCDALHFYDEVVPADEVVEAMKQERLNNWIAAITSPPVSPPSKYQRDENGNLILDENGDPIPVGA